MDDKRLCLICEQVISGREVRISGRTDDYRLGCPTLDCPGTFNHWLLYRPTVAAPPTLANEAAGEIDFLFETL